jgi:hypothetical protein
VNRIAAVGLGLSICVTAGCAARGIALPADQGIPLPDADQIHLDVSEACRGVRTLTAAIALSGRAGGERLSGTVHAGFARPASMYLEFRGAFGTVGFVFGARDDEATLLLPREERVVRAGPAEIFGALIGLTLAPADLQAILTGCVVPSPRPAGGRLHGNGWASIDLDGGATLYLQRARDRWRPRAARRGDLLIEYPEWPDTALFPPRVRLRADMPVAVDLTATLSQVETNTELASTVFTIDVPPGTLPITIDDLRASGPLREP